jgi:hypothetical protein
MDWQLYVYSLLAGILGANGLPHFVMGITGKKHQTPFGRPSSAIVNVVWGWVNFAVAGLLIYYAHVHPHLLRAFACVGVGALLIALLLAYTWSKHPEYNEGK